MDFNLPPELSEFLKNLDRFIDQEIRPLQAQDDNERFFDHRREWARTDFDNGGLPRHEWEDLLLECKKRADKAGFYRLSLPKEYGGQEIGNLWMAVIRDHLASQGPGPVQRPAERTLDGRQLPGDRDAARLRHAGAEGASSSTAS